MTEDPYLALLAYRTNIKHWLQSCRTVDEQKAETTLQILPLDLKPKVPDYSKLQSSEKDHRNKQEQKFDNRHAADSLISLKEGMTVWIQDHNCAGKVIDNTK